MVWTQSQFHPHTPYPYLETGAKKPVPCDEEAAFGNAQSQSQSQLLLQEIHLNLATMSARYPAAGGRHPATLVSLGLLGTRFELRHHHHKDDFQVALFFSIRRRGLYFPVIALHAMRASFKLL